MGFFRQASRTLSYVNWMDKTAKGGGDPMAWLDKEIERQRARNKEPDKFFGPKFRDQVIADYEKRLENRAKKRAALKTHAHCQICERSIQANTGVIAHHGYQRPGYGWQTPSCFGARYQPYEEACDAIQPYIDMVRAHKETQELRLKYLFEHPPETFTIMIKRVPYETKDLPRPDGFDPVKTDSLSYVVDKYSQHWKYEVGEARRQIESAKDEIDRMTKRLAEWKPKKTETPT